MGSPEIPWAPGGQKQERPHLGLPHPTLSPTQVAHGHPSVPAPSQAEENTSHTPCRGVQGAQGGVQPRTIEPFSKLGTGSWQGGQGGLDEAKTEPSPPGLPALQGSNSGLTGVDKRWLWGQQHGEGPLLPLLDPWPRLWFWAKIPQIRTVGVTSLAWVRRSGTP